MRKARTVYGRLKHNVFINLQIYDIMNEYRKTTSLRHSFDLLNRHRRHSVILKTVALARDTLIKQAAFRKLRWHLNSRREATKKASQFRHK